MDVRRETKKRSLRTKRKVNHFLKRRRRVCLPSHGGEAPTRSLGINRSSLPCFRNTFPLVWLGLMPTPSAAAGARGEAGVSGASFFFFAFARRGRFDILTELRETRRGTRDAPLVMMALVAAGTLNSSAAYLSTAVNGASSGTLSLFRGGRGRTRERRGFRSIASRVLNDAVPSDGRGAPSTRDTVRRRGARTLGTATWGPT